ncbi:hypothetical protein Sjap_013786 [Stephania japonica]|uniref:Uncharacterized protein n=1 Tax=Stephania japonica TaxID=461633 RepID=A0AAP0IYM7_9MAGN
MVHNHDRDPKQFQKIAKTVGNNPLISSKKVTPSPDMKSFGNVETHMGGPRLSFQLECRKGGGGCRSREEEQDSREGESTGRNCREGWKEEWISPPVTVVLRPPLAWSEVWWFGHQ